MTAPLLATRSITLATLPSLYAVARLAPQAAIPPWADGEGFVSISRSGEELSITCLQARVPDGVQADRGWMAFRFVGPFGFGETGIVLSVIRPLSENGIGIFVVSTFDGDHLLVSQADGERACALLAAAGHRVVPAAG
ncbi:ACT domain-containing protein [Acidovorax sp. SUPP3434]|uniref:ACT domain-containing protein n=1 Tax=Acidovorax sp. SUPP3434 TaxID=2920880 RepID=UPI0023DE3C9A|nr:ACT domain-containing protein [Acidovorax sp. SUPP3434]GKS99576.1 ACT domain-containing protein [Acidovorax sp. SUPP3434]